VKVVLASREGEAHFGLVRSLDLPGLQVVTELDPAKALAEVADADVFYGIPTLDVVKAGKKLRWIQSSSAGVEYTARIPELVESDILLTNTRGAHGPSIGEHTFALLFALTRKLPDVLDGQKEHQWLRPDLYRSCREVYGSTMGIIGFGQIGRAVAQRARGFDMEVLAVDAHAKDGAPWVEEVWPMSQLPDLLARSMVVVVSAPLTSSSRRLLNAEMLRQMQPGAYLIVVSRGGIVDETALVEALREGRLAGAGLDVTEVEPLPADSPLWDAPNIIITPHTAGSSSEKERRCVEILCDNLQRFANGEELNNLVDKRLGY
jgi:phosphoglycerate dehydrogenase-like enzyme